jgi:predicted AAA+ superfamily ATPase
LADVSEVLSPSSERLPGKVWDHNLNPICFKEYLYSKEFLNAALNIFNAKSVLFSSKHRPTDRLGV